MIDWWLNQRVCSCGDTRFAHLHYRKVPRRPEECSLCPCEHFQWHVFKWVY
jgi:hypothetical protein